MASGIDDVECRDVMLKIGCRQADAVTDKSLVRINAKVEREFEISHSVPAYLTPEQMERLRQSGSVSYRGWTPTRR